MKLRILTATSIIFLILFCLKEIASTSSLSPPPSRTGAPGEKTCVNNCHVGILNGGPGSLNFSLEGKKYTPDSTFALTVSITDTTKSRYGFQLTVLDKNNNMAGTFNKGQNTSLITAMSRNYIAHQNANGKKTWDFEWNAPDSNVGPVTFYLVGNAANNNQTNSGDNIYSKFYSIDPNTPLSIDHFAHMANDLVIYPNPVQTEINVKHPLINLELTSIYLVDMNGNRIILSETKTQPYRSKELKIILGENLPNGLYILILEAHEQKLAKRILVHN